MERYYTNESNLGLKLSGIWENGDFLEYFSGGDIGFWGKNGGWCVKM
jgi:hypothetical protein